MNTGERVAAAVLVLTVFFVLYCGAGVVNNDRAKHACRAMGYPQGGGARFLWWKWVCYGERGQPPPAMRETPYDDALKAAIER